METTIEFSPLIIGAMRLGIWGADYNTKQYESFIEGCLNLGINDFDHADIYGHYTTEEAFGEVLKRRQDLRDRVQLTTKCGIMLPCEQRPDVRVKHYDLSHNHIIQSVEQSLRNFGVEQIKLLLLHRPDYLMDVQEISAAFETLKTSGKVQNFGVSNFSKSQFDQLNQNFPLVNNQLEISLQNPELLLSGEINSYSSAQKLSAWSPLGGGAILNDNKALMTTIEEMASKYQCTPAQLLYSWIIKHPKNITPVTGTSKLERIEVALAATKIELSQQDWYILLEKQRGHCVD